MVVNAIKLPVILLLFGGILVAAGSGVHGPFVFGDESVYRGMIYAFSRGLGLSGYKQYGPLYPFIAAVTDRLFPAGNIYFLAKNLNIFFALTALIPFWKLAQNLLDKTWLFWLAIIGFILSPFWTYTVVTWAEPLFYSLFFWSAYLVYSAARSISSGEAGKRFLAAGVMCGLMFLAKPADIVYGVALITGYLLVYNRKIIHDAAYRTALLCLVMGWGVLVAPFILRNIFLEQTAALGYPYVGQLLQKLLNNSSVFEVAKVYLAAVAYHLSYVLVAGFGSLFVVYYLLLRFWKNISDGDKLLLLYLGFSLAAICLISSVHMIIFPPYGYRTPNGRYLTQFVPIFICILFYMYRKHYNTDSQKTTLRELPLFLSAPLLVLAASPLYVLGAFMIVNGPDLAVYFLMIEGKHIPWRSQFSPDLYQLLIPVAVTLLGLLPFMFYRIRAVAALVVITVWMIFLVAGIFHQSWLINTMAGTQKQMNKLFHRSSSGQMSVNLCAADVYYDSRLDNTNIPFLYQYWCPANKMNYLNPLSRRQKKTATINKENGAYIFTKENKVSRDKVIGSVDGYSLFKI